jgi:hypothetical protein
MNRTGEINCELSSGPEGKRMEKEMKMEMEMKMETRKRK